MNVFEYAIAREFYRLAREERDLTDRESALLYALHPTVQRLELEEARGARPAVASK